jgi:hypothetical protein
MCELLELNCKRHRLESGPLGLPFTLSGYSNRESACALVLLVPTNLGSWLAPSMHRFQLLKIRGLFGMESRSPRLLLCKVGNFCSRESKDLVLGIPQLLSSSEWSTPEANEKHFSVMFSVPDTQLLLSHL